ncbi:MAG: GNAT family N-acetyltransferase, partial [Dysgonamonadaceae bacterium]|nr:GNAT family N-acetyltransferase [Dysgonamonadaceae bacterium]
KNGEIEAAMPYYVPCKGIISMPLYTQTMGIWFNPAFEDKCYSHDLFRKQTICGDFIMRLPAHGYFLQNFHYSFTDWLPFYWQGFRQTTRYTYVLPDIGNPDELWEGLSENICRNVRKAKNKYQLTVRRNVPADLFLKLNAQVYQRQGMKPYQQAMLKKLINLSRSHNQGDVWGAYDTENHLYAGVFVVWQQNYAYYIAGGNDTESRKSGGLALAMWTAINDLSGQVHSFDFEGSMIRGVEHFFREFGALQKPYFAIEKGKMSLLKKIRMKFFKIKN